MYHTKVFYTTYKGDIPSLLCKTSNDRSTLMTEIDGLNLHWFFYVPAFTSRH